MYGLACERALGMHASTEQRPDFQDGELKTTSLRRKKNGQWSVKESLAITFINPEDVMRDPFDKSAIWKKLQNLLIVLREYGPGTAKVLRHIRAGQPWQQASRASYKDGSIGNGGAMRIPVVAMFYHGQPLDILLEKTRLVTEITHAHPAAIEGAALVALCVSFALQGFPMADALKYFVTAYPGTLFLSKVHRLQTLVTSHTTPSPSEIVHQFGNGIVALDSCVTAMAIAHCFKDKPFQSLVEFTAQCKGDVDTIAAMAGAWWGATNGDAGLQKIAIEDREAIVRVGEQLYAHISSYCN